MVVGNHDIQHITLFALNGIPVDQEELVLGQSYLPEEYTFDMCLS